MWEAPSGAERPTSEGDSIRIGDTHVIAKRTPVNQQVERSLVPMALTPAGLDPLKPQVRHPRLALPILIRCQTSLNSLIYRANFGNYERVTPTLLRSHRRSVAPK